ncbi:hypothetical protein, partial [Stenotrophomonas sp. 3(2025)]|uniref:hypothetical protein n=1 Tax=Stenotrophomonas sp. 3(2025) TaxID=3456023 RepID=UPI004044ECFD
MALKPSREMLATVQGRGEVIDHRGKILPLHRLHRRFEIEGAVGLAPEQPQRQFNGAGHRAPQVGEVGDHDRGSPGPGLVRPAGGPPGARARARRGR